MRLFSSYPDEKTVLSRWLQEMPHAWLAYGIGHLTTLARPTSALWQLCPLIGHGIYGRRVLVYYCHGMYMTIPISSLLVVTVGDMPSRHRSFSLHTCLFVSDRPNSSLKAMAGPCQSAYFDSSNHLREVDCIGYASPGPGLAEFAFAFSRFAPEISLTVKAELQFPVRMSIGALQMPEIHVQETN